MVSALQRDEQKAPNVTPGGWCPQKRLQTKEKAGGVAGPTATHQNNPHVESTPGELGSLWCVIAKIQLMVKLKWLNYKQDSL